MVGVKVVKSFEELIELVGKEAAEKIGQQMIKEQGLSEKIGDSFIKTLQEAKAVGRNAKAIHTFMDNLNLNDNEKTHALISALKISTGSASAPGADIKEKIEQTEEECHNAIMGAATLKRMLELETKEELFRLCVTILQGITIGGDDFIRQIDDFAEFMDEEIRKEEEGEAEVADSPEIKMTECDCPACQARREQEKAIANHNKRNDEVKNAVDKTLKEMGIKR